MRFPAKITSSYFTLVACGEDGRSGGRAGGRGVRSRDYQIFSDGSSAIKVFSKDK